MMKRLTLFRITQGLVFLFFILFVYLIHVYSAAPSFTVVTATLTDGSSQVWANAVITVSLRNSPNNPGVPLNNGNPIIDTPQTIAADATGTFSVTVDSTTAITPSGASWTFTMCPNATVAICSTVNLPVTGASQNLSTALSTVLQTPVVSASPTIYRAYSDSEAVGSTGSLYWNTITNVIKGCLGIPCVWTQIGGSATGSIIVINVQSFGALGNGVHDDTTNINNAINACPQSVPTIGCVVYFPAGQYKTTGTLQVALLKSVKFLGDGTVGTGGAASTIQTNAAYFAVTIGTGLAPDTSGFEATNLGFQDMTGNGLGGFNIQAARDGALTNISCINYFVGACVELDGGTNFTQFFTLTNIYSWHTKFGIQSNHKVASIYIVGGEFNCQNNGSTDIITGSVGIDFGFTNQGNSAGTGTVSESMVETQTQNCQYGIALWNGGGNRFFGKAVEETINARPNGSFGVFVDGDTPSLANGNYFDGVQITKAGTAFYLKPNATNTTIITPIFNGTNGNDIVVDQGALGSTRIFANKRFTGWTTNISAIARAGNVVTATTTANSDNGNLSVQQGSLLTIFNVTNGTTNFNGIFPLTSVSTNNGTGITTLTWNQNGGNESGTINATACGGQGSCVAALSTVLSAGVGVLEYTGEQITQHLAMQVPNMPNQENLFPGCLSTTNLIFFDSLFTDICEANVGLLHLSNGPNVNFNGSVGQFYSPQPTTFVGGLGTVNTSGTAVTWVSGTLFNQSWINSNITINNAVFVISAVNNSLTALTLTGTAGVQNGVNYLTSGLIGVPACTNPSGNVCVSSDDKGHMFANNTNGTSVCLPTPGKANGYPSGFIWTPTFNPGNSAAILSIALPGETSTNGILCPGTIGPTLDGLLINRDITRQSGTTLWSDGNNWKSIPGTPYIPVDQLQAALSTNTVNIVAGNFNGGGAGANNGGIVNVIGGNSNSSGGAGGTVNIGPGQDAASGISGQLNIYQMFTSGASTTGKEHLAARLCNNYGSDCSNTSPANLGNSARITVSDIVDTGSASRPIGIITAGSAIGQPLQIQTYGENTVKVENNCTVGQFIEVSQQTASNNGFMDCTSNDSGQRIGFYNGPAGAAGCTVGAPCTVSIFISPVGATGQYLFNNATCTPASSTDANCTGTINFANTFGDTNYAIFTQLTSSTGAFVYVSVVSKAAASFNYNITCTFGCGSGYGTMTMDVFVHHN